jgi:signal transduction histidine kinase
MQKLDINHLSQNVTDHDEAPVGASVLIVDDEAIIRDLCGKALKGYRVLEAGNGEEALEVFRKEPVEVILTDVMMPRMGGLELLRKLKELEPTVLVVVMTGFADKDVILNALKADADDFITKPLNLLQLKTTIDNVLVKKALKEEIANLKRMDRFKSNFLSLISHKFRTPITSISLFLQNIANGVCAPDNPEYQKYAQLTYEESCYLGRLVADLLSFSRVMDDGGGLKLEPCSLEMIIIEILRLSKEAADKPHVRTVLNFDHIPSALVDREKLTFALKQIIENAFKFSGDSGTVTIALSAQDGMQQIVVEDTGIGIFRDDLPKIFEKFYQVDLDNCGQIRGFGLGLSYAREFVRLHGGTITVSSEPSCGTRVTVAVPLRPA